MTLAGDSDQQPSVLFKDKHISDPKVDDLLTRVRQCKQACVDVEEARLKKEQLDNNLDALRKRILNMKIDQVSTDDCIHNDNDNNSIMITSLHGMEF
jgi:hypothetical protein